MDFSEFDKDFNKLKNMLQPIGQKDNDSSYRFSKDDIKQDDVSPEERKKANIERIKNIKFQKDKPSPNPKPNYDFSYFTEIEDENGEIVLVWYSKAEYIYRGNKYCRYILCNEKTGYSEEGVAQIKNGRYEYIKDEERSKIIQQFMLENNPIFVKEYCKDLKEPGRYFFKPNSPYVNDNMDLTCIGWIETKCDIKILYRLSSYYNEEYVVRYLYGSYGEKENKNYLWYDIEDIPSLYNDKSFHIIQEIEIENDDNIFLAEGSYENTVCNLYKNSKTNKLHAWIGNKKISSWEIEDIINDFKKSNDDISYQAIASSIAKKDFFKELEESGHLKSYNQKCKNKKISSITIPLLSLLYLYIGICIILGICECILPLFMSNISASAAQQFTLKYLPYGFHPDKGVISILMMNILCFVLIKYFHEDVSYSDKNIYWNIVRGIVCVVCFASIFSQQGFNAVAGTAMATIIIFKIIRKILDRDCLLLLSEKFKLLSLNIILIALIASAIIVPEQFFPIYNIGICIVCIVLFLKNGFYFLDF